MTYPRDLVGYGSVPPDPQWPGRARVALQIVMNYEEGGERSILHGDTEAESFLHEVVGSEPVRGARHRRGRARSREPRVALDRLSVRRRSRRARASAPCRGEPHQGDGYAAAW